MHESQMRNYRPQDSVQVHLVQRCVSSLPWLAGQDPLRGPVYRASRGWIRSPLRSSWQSIVRYPLLPAPNLITMDKVNHMHILVL